MAASNSMADDIFAEFKEALDEESIFFAGSLWR